MSTTPPEEGGQITSKLLLYVGRLLFLTGLAVLVTSIFLHASLWPMGVLLILVSLFVMAIAYALSLPA